MKIILNDVPIMTECELNEVIADHNKECVDCHQDRFCQTKDDYNMLKPRILGLKKEIENRLKQLLAAQLAFECI